MGQSRADDPRRTGWLRLAAGFAQGLAFYGLWLCGQHKVWPSTDPVTFAAIGGAVFFAPLVGLAGLGGLRRATLAVWLVGAAAVAAGLSGYEVWRGADATGGLWGHSQMVVPTFFAICAALFIAHRLIAAADESKRLIAPYPLYFDAAWKHAVQLVLSLAFLGAFWAVLELGGALFALIGVKALQTTINKPWFFMPVSGLVFAGGVHLTDVRPAMTRGLRTIGLTLLSWLMPLMGLLTAAFLLALPFTGLSALWKVGHATALLLAASAALILLLNAAYQDGTAETRAPKLLQWAGRITAVALLPMAVLAGVGLWVRIDQHGLTPERIIAGGCLVCAAAYALGYVAAALRPGPWLKGLETTNVVVAFVDLLIILALFTPIADPARISVADQTARLTAGRVAPDAFDWRFLRFGAGRYGRDALKTLAKGGQGPRAAEIAKRAGDALKSTNPYEFAPPPAAPLAQPAPVATRVVMHPAGARLPESFVRAAPSGPVAMNLGACTAEKPCDAVVVDLGPQDRSDLVILAPPARVIVFRAEADGDWKVRGNVFAFGCGELAEPFRKGDVRPATPELSDLEIGGRRYRVNVARTCGPTVAPAPLAAQRVRVSPAGAR